MKKILVVITTAFVKTGGLSSVMLNYWRSIDKSGLSFDFASSNVIDDVLNQEITREGSRYFQLPPRKSIISYFIQLKKICKGYNIIHVHANSSTAIIELIAAKLAGVHKRIHHNHTSRSKYPLINTLLHPFFIRSLTCAVACSDKAGEWLFGNGNFQILQNAINVDAFSYNPSARNEERLKYGIREDEVVVGHIGKFMDAKNHEFLIKIFAKYHCLNPKSKLLLVGDGIWRAKVEKWVLESGCPDAIILAGLCTNIPSIIQSFDIFVFPSIYEGLPLTVLEAQAAGLPCLVSSNVTSSVNVGCDFLFLSIEESAFTWASRIDALYSSMSREKRCDVNRELLTKAGFNILNEANKLRCLYDE